MAMCSSRLGFLGAVSLGLALAACGARSTLSLPAGAAAEGGSGGSGTTASTTSSSSAAGGSGGTGSTTGSGGTGGSGGATPVLTCSTLVVDGPALTPVTGFGSGYQYAPWLAYTEPDRSRAAFVYVEDPQPFGEFMQSASVALTDPWGAWPASLGPSAHHALSDGFVVGGGRSGRFTMLTTDEPKNAGNDPEGMIVWAPHAGMSGAEGQYFDDVPPGRPSLVASNADRFIAGFQRSVGGSLQHLTLAGVSFGLGPVSIGQAVTCGLGASLAGAAIPLGNGFLAALSNGRPFGKCLTDDLADGPPSRLQVVTMNENPSLAKLTFEHDEPGTYIVQTHLAPAPGGAWVAWERASSGPPFPRRIQLVRLDAAGAPVDGTILEVSFGTSTEPFAIASLGQAVAVAARSDVLNLSVHVVGSDGAPLGAATFEPELGLGSDGSVALLASPIPGRLLVGWSEWSVVNNDHRRVRLARLACAD